MKLKPLNWIQVKPYWDQYINTSFRKGFDKLTFKVMEGSVEDTGKSPEELVVIVWQYKHVKYSRGMLF